MPYTEPRSLRSATARAPALIACLALGSCAPAEMPAAVSSVQPLPSPAEGESLVPFLHGGAGAGVVLSWLEAAEGRSHRLRVSRLDGDGWSTPVTIAERDDFFVNWADFPTVAEVEPGVLVAHWLQRGGTGTYDYGVRVVHSRDDGRTWSEPWTPHEDGTPTEHGFASLFPVSPGRWGMVWLDGRQFHAAEGEVASEEMTLRYRDVDLAGTPGPEVLVDARICDCCQTDVALTSQGPLVVYRDRSPEEIRDIYVTRLVDGSWTPGRPVHADGWEIGACPVNGPAAAARGEQVAVAWFTGAADTPRVRLAFSGDAGATFGAPLEIDDGNPAGRVDVLLLDDGSALVSWLERLGEGRAEVRLRRAWSDGRRTAPVTVTASSDARASGFPRMVLAPDGALVLAWTRAERGSSRVELARAQVPGR